MSLGIGAGGLSPSSPGREGLSQASATFANTQDGSEKAIASGKLPASLRGAWVSDGCGGITKRAHSSACSTKLAILSPHDSVLKQLSLAGERGRPLILLLLLTSPVRRWEKQLEVV